MEVIELDINESNELTFKVQIEGADNIPANIRLVCEAEEMDFVFKARPSREVNTFDFALPSMKSKLKEGTYKGRVEVLLENKYFSPIEFEMSFKQSVKVMAESISRKPEPQKVEPKVTITPVVTKKPSVTETHQTGQTLKDRYTSKKK